MFKKVWLLQFHNQYYDNGERYVIVYATRKLARIHKRKVPEKTKIFKAFIWDKKRKWQ